MKKIAYIVMCQTGEYDDQHQYPVEAFTNEEMAEAKSKELNLEATQLSKIRSEYYDFISSYPKFTHNLVRPKKADYHIQYPGMNKNHPDFEAHQVRYYKYIEDLESYEKQLTILHNSHKQEVETAVKEKFPNHNEISAFDSSTEYFVEEVPFTE